MKLKSTLLCISTLFVTSTALAGQCIKLEPTYFADLLSKSGAVSYREGTQNMFIYENKGETKVYHNLNEQDYAKAYTGCEFVDRDDIFFRCNGVKEYLNSDNTPSEISFAIRHYSDSNANYKKEDGFLFAGLMGVAYVAIGRKGPCSPSDRKMLSRY